MQFVINKLKIQGVQHMGIQLEPTPLLQTVNHFDFHKELEFQKFMVQYIREENGEFLDLLQMGPFCISDMNLEILIKGQGETSLL